MTLPAGSSDVLVRANGLGKRYQRLHQKPMLFRDLVLLGKRRGTREDFWALRGVSFELNRGETVGVVGSNGSGKSTLLSLVAGTSFPSEGSISVRGRISLLLELGAGFHGDMTGVENILVNAAILGIEPGEIRKAVDEIVAFAELEKAIDTPVRFYSSGMLARLGFAIAVHLRPDILLVDEVLAVGDLAFQAKCMRHIETLRASDAAILVVSHAIETLRKISNRVMWVQDGALRDLGEPHTVLDAYLAEQASRAVPPAADVAGALPTSR